MLRDMHALHAASALCLVQQYSGLSGFWSVYKLRVQPTSGEFEHMWMSDHDGKHLEARHSDNAACSYFLMMNVSHVDCDRAALTLTWLKWKYLIHWVWSASLSGTMQFPTLIDLGLWFCIMHSIRCHMLELTS